MGKAEEVRAALTTDGPAAPWRKVSDALLAALVAPRCAACDHLLDEPTRGAVCADCWRAVRVFTPPLCPRCGVPLPPRRGEGSCPACPKPGAAVDEARAVGPYDGTLRLIIHAFKYGGRRSLAAPLASLLRRQAGDLLARTDLLVPVPLHWSRHHARGFNQAADLAVHLGEPVAHALRRTVRTATQVTLPSARRHANVRAAFALRSQRWRAAGDRRDLLAGASITLVDDVCTTGATLQACGQVLKQAGARRIGALMLAKVWT